MSKLSPKNRVKKQLAARRRLEEARKQDRAAVEVFTGNQFVRQLVQGKHLAPGVEPFPLTAEEEQSLRAYQEAAKICPPEKKPKTLEDVADLLRRASAKVMVETELSNMFRVTLGLPPVEV